MRVPATPAPFPAFKRQTPSTPSPAFYPTTQGFGNLQTCTKMNDVSGLKAQHQYSIHRSKGLAYFLI
ncbi:hypothetical protein DPMN_027113 [Dreissena polymorpha]|uniref:Uncharacterized protein n=1 Tax=Dreissena polymorpha TaxID=45954 RepID=A0A9D4LUL8_DREPO|nr:hypothetical protein DPMN_027113 [Dreissena polymorpha]